MSEELKKEIKDKRQKGSNMNFPEINNNLRKKVNLVLYHDGNASTSSLINDILHKFSNYFELVYLISEEPDISDGINKTDNLRIVSTLRPVNLDCEWVLILEPGEFPSIQILNNLQNIFDSVKPEIKIIKLPLVLCDYKNGEILEILEPAARIFKQNPQILQKGEEDEVILDDYPLIKLYINYEEHIDVQE